MKEIALLGTTDHVFAKVLGKLLENGMSVKALVDFPEKVMLNNSALTVEHLPLGQHERVVEALQGYHDVILTYNDDLRDVYTNELTLKYFVDTVHAAREAGVARIIVVGSPDSEAFFVSDLRRLDDIDWVFISTEGDFSTRAAQETAAPHYHKEVYVD
ncbi:MAG: NAD(P)H-binding protein [Muribaculaceae bacterium]|nr:NAD(P)H-binding protein [Muribaculaceae bacterium]